MKASKLSDTVGILLQFLLIRQCSKTSKFCQRVAVVVHYPQRICTSSTIKHSWKSVQVRLNPANELRIHRKFWQLDWNAKIDRKHNNDPQKTIKSSANCPILMRTNISHHSAPDLQIQLHLISVHLHTNIVPHHRIPFCILWTLHSTVNFRTATPHTVAVVMSLGGHLYARKFIHIEVPWQSMQWWMLAKTQQEHWGLGLIQYVNNYCFNLTEIGKKWKKPPNTIFLSLCLFFAFTSLLPWWHVDLQVSATPRSGENSMIRMDHVKILRSSPAVEICCDTFGSKLSKPYPHWHIDPHLSFIRIWRSSSPLTSSRGSCRRDESATCHPADHWTVSATVEDNSSTCICRWIPYP